MPVALPRVNATMNRPERLLLDFGVVKVGGGERVRTAEAVAMVPPCTDIRGSISRGTAPPASGLQPDGLRAIALPF